MDFAQITPQAMLDSSFIAQQGQMASSADEQPGLVELLLGAVLDSTCGSAAPVLLTAYIDKPLRSGRYELEASLRHADGRQQRWLAEVRQEGDIVGRAHVVLDAELPSSSYVPWRSGVRAASTMIDDGFGQYLAIVRICDSYSHSHTAAASNPVWFTVRYFDNAEQWNMSGPLTISLPRDEQFGVLQHVEIDVLREEVKIAAVTTVYEDNHA